MQRDIATSIKNNQQQLFLRTTTNTGVNTHIIDIYIYIYIIFFFWLLPLGIATANFPSPLIFVPLILHHFSHCHQCHALSPRIHIPTLRPSPFSLSWQLHTQHPSPNIPIIFRPYKPPQSYIAGLTVTCTPSTSFSGVEIKPNFPLAWGMSSPEKLLVPKKNH